MDLLSHLSTEAASILATLPLTERSRSERLLGALGQRAGAPPEALPLLEDTIAALRHVPDADMALLNLERWAGHLPTPLTTLAALRDDPRLHDGLLRLLGSSQYLADILVREPWLYTLLLEPELSGAPDALQESIEQAFHPLRHAEARWDALRRLKRREFLRIGVLDLVREAPLEWVVREISDLADALVAGGLRLAREEVDARFPTAAAATRFAVIAMGKLGARELNYSSDIDLIFVMDGDQPLDEGQRRYATRLAETLIAVLSRETGEGRCFRVDMRLRPEGRFGSLVRSYDAFRTYFDRWAETWERQALIKARPIAGDAALGRRFIELTRPVTYRRLQGPSLLEDVREMRAAVERKLAQAGHSELNVKEGRGTIRDVEFTLQLLQLLFGADHPSLQSPDTFTTLERLEDAGTLSAEERRTFEEGYRFFREVEHRLQLMNDLPVRVVPQDPVTLRRLARTMGFDEAPEFLAAFHAHSDGVRALAERIHARLGAESGAATDELRAAILLADRPDGEHALREVLAKRGFPDPEAALRALVGLAVGPAGYPHPASTRRLFGDLAPDLLNACAASADPTWALAGVQEFADRKLLHRSLFQTMLEHPGASGGLARFAGAAPWGMRVVLRYPELADVITDQELLQRSKDRLQFDTELAARMAAAVSHSQRLATLRRYKLREFVRLAARHVLAPVLAEAETREWSDLADALLSAGLETAVLRLREAGRWPTENAAGFSVFALGRYGGQDLHFASDLDLLYVSGGEEALSQQQYELLARELSDVLQAVTEEGKLFELDLRLRPEGRQGFSVSSLESARRYYGEGGRSETWEFQMLTRLRAVAGDTATAAAFETLIRPRVFRDPMPDHWRDDIAAMKRRIERERVSDADRDRHLKLGPGGLSDIEFLVQFLQLRHGGTAPSLQVTSTVVAVAALTQQGLLSSEEGGALATAYRLLTRARQSLSLMRPDGSSDVLPSPEEGRLALALARALGFERASDLEAELTVRRAAVRDLLLRWLP